MRGLAKPEEFLREHAALGQRRGFPRRGCPQTSVTTCRFVLRSVEPSGGSGAGAGCTADQNATVNGFMYTVP
jgi:hypothetical protein